MTIHTNPLLQSEVLPFFNGVKPSDVEPAISALIDLNEQTLTDVLSLDENNYTWESLVEPLDEAEDKLEKAWSVVSHLNSVLNCDELREAYEASQQKLTAYYSAIGQNETLYQAYQSLLREEYVNNLTQPQKKAIENAIRDFKLAGVALNEEDKKRYTQIAQSLSKLTTTFANNVLDATQSWYKHITDESQLSGITDMAKQAAQKAAQDKNLDGWVFTLDIPSYLAVMTYAENRTLRQEVYKAYATRASQYADLEKEQKQKLDNTNVIEQILALRQKKAKLLEFDNYAALSIAPKMATTTDQVLDFLHDLAQKARPQAYTEKAELETFAKKEYSIEKLEPWDVGFVSEKLKENLFNISQEKVREYFPLNKVLHGMFGLVEKLFSIQVEKNTEVQTYHDDVMVYDVLRNNEKIAQFYFDLYTRDKKRGGAWMADARGKKQLDGQSQTPVAFLVCNFTPPLNDTPCLLTHNDVTTLFHEFGHGLHHMLTKITVSAVSGISGVAWDAVELPSQFMENFCWEESILPSISGHYQTNEALPKDMLKSMLVGKNFQSAMQMVRQIEFSMFDFILHEQCGKPEFSGVQPCLDEVRKNVAVFTPPSFNQFQNSFSHIFAGGYAAGYYSYKWAEVLSADAFSAFEEEGVTNKETGKRFLTSILEMGGSEDAMALFEAFRGRKPEINALLRHSGIKAA